MATAVTERRKGRRRSGTGPPRSNAPSRDRCFRPAPSSPTTVPTTPELIRTIDGRIYYVDRENSELGGDDGYRKKEWSVVHHCADHPGTDPIRSERSRECPENSEQEDEVIAAEKTMSWMVEEEGKTSLYRRTLWVRDGGGKKTTWAVRCWRKTWPSPFTTPDRAILPCPLPPPPRPKFTGRNKKPVTTHPYDTFVLPFRSRKAMAAVAWTCRT